MILDDAGFISEAEAIVPLVMHRSVNQLVLLGDLEMPESQIKDPLASQLGLSQSLLQRHSERAQKLTTQYRCVRMHFQWVFFSQCNIFLTSYLPFKASALYLKFCLFMILYIYDICASPPSLYTTQFYIM